MLDIVCVSNVEFGGNIGPENEQICSISQDYMGCNGCSTVIAPQWAAEKPRHSNPPREGLKGGDLLWHEQFSKCGFGPIYSEPELGCQMSDDSWKQTGLHRKGVHSLTR